MVEKFQFVSLGSLRGDKRTRISTHLGKLSAKAAQRSLRFLLKLHPIFVVANTVMENGVKKPWLVVAGHRSYWLARSVICESEKIPVLVQAAFDHELAVIDDIASVLMFSDSPEIFWGAWESFRENGDIRALGRDLDEVAVVEEILGRKRKMKRRVGSADVTPPISNGTPEDAPPEVHAYMPTTRSEPGS